MCFLKANYLILLAKNILLFLDYIYQDENFVILKRKFEKAQALRRIIG